MLWPFIGSSTVSPLKGGCLVLVLLAASTAQGANLLCCQDQNGRRACSDSLPEQCRGRPYKVLDGAGNVIKEVGPPLTAEQKAQAEAEARRKKEQEAAQQEQRRKDQALLATYSSLQDIESARSRSEADVQEAIKQAESRIAALRQKRKKFENEAEFYRNKAVPPEVAKGLRDIDSAVKAESSIVDAKKAEFQIIRAKYDDDKRRYLELSGSR